MSDKKQNLAIFGAQWGDEGKGKIVDLLCEEFDLVARYQGGHNAGHTVRFAEKHYSLHLIPSGILHPGKLCVLGNGMVIDPKALLDEIDKLRGLGVHIGENLTISDSAHCILPIHRELDLAREEAAGDQKIGTTGRGIGPAYEMKLSRHGVVMADLLDPDILREKVRFACGEKNAILTSVYGREAVDVNSVVDTYIKYGETLRNRITDTTLLVNEQIRQGKRVMFEGAQGMLLDVDHGTYPYVTSSNTIVGGICTGLGVPPKQIHSVTAVVKAYTTRVGGGPFPTELLDATGDHVRQRGNEFGTTTGRPRRIGWLDLVVLRTAVMLNGIDEIALTKLDVLDDFEEIPICTSYDVDGDDARYFPRRAVSRNQFRPNYVTTKGWKQSTVGISNYDELPQAAKDYVRRIEDELEVPITIVSTGPRREETILRG
jgi:adenylosuccinate synthase